jgi:hypothetical protein
MYCCSGLENRVLNAGKRGIAIVVLQESDGDLHFFLQSRGIAFEDESRIKPLDIEIKINISAEVGLRHCPFCGRMLKDLIRENREFFAELSKEHEKYLASMPKL